MKRLTLVLISVAFNLAVCRAQEFPAVSAFVPAAILAELPPAVPQPACAQSLSGEALFQCLHETTSPRIPGRPTDYLEAKKYMFSVADNTGCQGGPGVTGLYSQVCVKGASQHGEDYQEPGDANGDGVVDSGGMNAEHSWPQSFFDRAYPMKADLHHIFPTFITVNSMRGSEPFAVVAKASYSTRSGSKLGAEGFEPADAAKGDIARAMLYFVTRYYDVRINSGMDYRKFWKSRVQMFLDWNRQDPPDADEKRRNGLIEKFQGNRNPFVDDTTLAGRVGAEVFSSH